MQTLTIDIRPRRQVTLPKDILKQVGISVGDQVKAYVKNKNIIFKPQTRITLNAFKELQKVAQNSGVSLNESQTHLKVIRKHYYARSST